MFVPEKSYEKYGISSSVANVPLLLHFHCCRLRLYHFSPILFFTPPINPALRNICTNTLSSSPPLPCLYTCSDISYKGGYRHTHTHAHLYVNLYGTLTIPTNLSPIITSTLKPSLGPQAVIWSFGNQPKWPHFAKEPVVGQSCFWFPEVTSYKTEKFASIQFLALHMWNPCCFVPKLYLNPLISLVLWR